MNNSYTLSFLRVIIYLFNMVLTNRDEVIQQYFKSGFSYISTSVEKNLKKLGLSRKAHRKLNQ